MWVQGRSGDGRVGDLATALAVVGVVGPGGLDRVGPGRERDVLRGALPGGDPGALVGVLEAGPVGPAANGELVGDGLGVFVFLDTRTTVGHAVGGRVDEVRATAGAQVRDVGHVGEGQVAVRRARRATSQRGIAGVVVPR